MPAENAVPRQCPDCVAGPLGFHRSWAKTCVDFADFAGKWEALFRSFLNPDNRLPSRDRFSRLFRLIESKGFATGFACFLDPLASRALRSTAHQLEQFAGRLVQGKVLRQSIS